MKPEEKLPHTLSAIIDATGVVVARIITAILFSIVCAIPVLVAAYFLRSFPNLAPMLAIYFCYAFVALAITNLLLRFDIDLPDAAIVILLAPTIPVIFVWIFSIGNDKRDAIYATVLAGRHVGTHNVTRMIFYVIALLCFCLCVYFTGLSSALVERFFVGPNYPKSIYDAALFTFDVAISGLLFDFFEHFKIHFSNVVQTPDLLGKSITYLLRVLSLIVAINAIVSMVSSVRQSLRVAPGSKPARKRKRAGERSL